MKLRQGDLIDKNNRYHGAWAVNRLHPLAKGYVILIGEDVLRN